MKSLAMAGALFVSVGGPDISWQQVTALSWRNPQGANDRPVLASSKLAVMLKS